MSEIENLTEADLRAEWRDAEIDAAYLREALGDVHMAWRRLQAENARLREALRLARLNTQWLAARFEDNAARLQSIGMHADRCAREIEDALKEEPTP